MEKVGGASIGCLTCATRADGLCTNLSPSSLTRIKRFKLCDRKIEAGEDIFGPGEPCKAIYNLVDGRACRYDLLEYSRDTILVIFLNSGTVVLNYYNQKNSAASVPVIDYFLGGLSMPYFSRRYRRT